METLLLPGMDGTGGLFAALQRHLAPELGARVVHFSPDRPRTYEQLLGEIPIPASSFAVVAESFSGPLGIRVAARFSDRVTALVLVTTFARRPSALGRLLRPVLGPLFRVQPPDLALRIALIGMDASAHDVAELRSVLSSVDPKVLAARLREVVSIDVSRELRGSSPDPLHRRGQGPTRRRSRIGRH